MKYDKRTFEKEVKEYKKELPDVRGKMVFAISDIGNERAFYSFAPLSRAVHEKKGEFHAMVVDKKSGVLEVLFDTWTVYSKMLEGKSGKDIKALKEFIAAAEKKIGKGKFKKTFMPPEYIITADKEGFVGNISLSYRPDWFRKHNWKKLVETADTIWDQVYNLKRREVVGVGFEAIPLKPRKPLEDYLDSYPICTAMAASAKKKARYVSMSASTTRDSMLTPMERVSDLKATISGCELSRHSKEDVFRKFSALARYIKPGRARTNDATFLIAGDGYAGRHAFGQMIGYPSPNNKTRWQSPGQIIYKLDYLPQTREDSRPPQGRYGFTETLPLGIFIKTCNVDWFEIKRKNDALKRIAARSERIIVRSNIKEKYMTNLEVGLVKKDGVHRWARGSDVDIRNKINKEYYRMTGIKAGCMANLPGGEMFVTPEYIIGTFVGDVVISVNESLRLNEKEPLIVSVGRKGYKIVTGPKKIISAIKKRKGEAMRQILEQEKSKSMPKKLTLTKKNNFERIGEFAINTNPAAELCDYLIVNEKIKGMIHIALGSGFEADRATEYHYDIVINAARQKLDIYGLDGKNRKIWAMKKGKLAV